MNRKNLVKIFNPGLLKSQKAIEILKRDFLLNDIKHKKGLENGEKVKIDLNESKIDAEVIVGESSQKIMDEFGFEEDQVVLEYDMVEIDFYEELVLSLCDTLNDFKAKFISELDKKGVYTNENLEGFKNFKLKKINAFILDLETNTDIENHAKECLLEFYNKLYDYISNFKLENYQVSTKLKFKLNKNQLIWLFHTMYDKGVITGISNLDMYRILETNSMYFDDGRYEDMKGVRIQVHKLIKGSSSPKNSIEVLSQIFNENFFSSSI